MRAPTRIGATAVLLTVTGALLLFLAPAPGTLPGSLARTFRDPRLAVERGGADEVVRTVAAAAAWLVLCWLGCTLVVLVLGALPGAAGRVARGVARRIVPGTVRRLLATALGLGLAAGVGIPATAAPAWAGTTQAVAGAGALPPHPPGAGLTPWAGPIPPAGLDLDWPVAAPTPGPRPGGHHAATHAPRPTGATPPAPATAPGPAAPPRGTTPPDPATPPHGTTPTGAAAPGAVRDGAHDTPAGPTTAPRPTTGARSSEHGTTVTVRSGDSLWAIAGRHLGHGATTREIAAEWPRWWAANRHLVGGDPDVIHPGQHLAAPDPDPLTGSTP